MTQPRPPTLYEAPDDYMDGEYEHWQDYVYDDSDCALGYFNDSDDDEEYQCDDDLPRLAPSPSVFREDFPPTPEPSPSSFTEAQPKAPRKFSRSRSGSLSAIWSSLTSVEERVNRHLRAQFGPKEGSDPKGKRKAKDMETPRSSLSVGSTQLSKGSVWMCSSCECRVRECSSVPIDKFRVPRSLPRPGIWQLFGRQGGPSLRQTECTYCHRLEYCEEFLGLPWSDEMDDVDSSKEVTQ